MPFESGMSRTPLPPHVSQHLLIRPEPVDVTPKDQAHLPAGAGSDELRKAYLARPIRCNDWFGRRLLPEFVRGTHSHSAIPLPAYQATLAGPSTLEEGPRIEREQHEQAHKGDEKHQQRSWSRDPPPGNIHTANGDADGAGHVQIAFEIQRCALRRRTTPAQQLGPFGEQ